MNMMAMTKLSALLQFLFALCGCSLGGTNFSDRVSVDGTDLLYSRAHVQDGVARFACVASSSGRCHYTLFADNAMDTCNAGIDQTGTSRTCPPAPLQRFAVDAGDSRQMTALPAFKLCVSVDDEAQGMDCKPVDAHPDARIASTPSR